MSTLKEAVESGRRWRFKTEGVWHGPGHAFPELMTVKDAVYADFEIEPEGPREYFVHDEKGRHELIAWRAGESPGHTPPEYSCVRVHDAEACERRWEWK